MRVAPGALWLQAWLTLEQQQTLVARCAALMDGPAGGYVPTVRGGGRMRVRMMCLGRHWNPLTYTYEATRADHDAAPVAPLPTDEQLLVDSSHHAGLVSSCCVHAGRLLVVHLVG